MKRFSVSLIALALFAAGCSKDSSPTTPSTPTRPTFTAELRASNEVPPIAGAEAGGTGNATVTFDVTRDASNNVTAATATFVVNISGLPPGTPINIAHIHEAPAGVNGSVRVSTTLTAGELNLATGSGSFTRTGIAVNPVDLANQIIANPAGFYFNAHSSLNPGGVVRGQLVRVQ